MYSSGAYHGPKIAAEAISAYQLNGMEIACGIFGAGATIAAWWAVALAGLGIKADINAAACDKITRSKIERQFDAVINDFDID